MFDRPTFKAFNRLSKMKKIKDIVKSLPEKLTPIPNKYKWDVLAKINTMDDFIPACIECVNMVGRYEMPMQDAEKIVNLLSNIDKLSTNQNRKFTLEKIMVIQKMYENIEKSIEYAGGTNENV